MIKSEGISKPAQMVLLLLWRRGKHSGRFGSKVCLSTDLIKWGINQNRLVEYLEELYEYDLAAFANRKDIEKDKSEYEIEDLFWYFPKLKYRNVKFVILFKKGEELAKILNKETEGSIHNAS